MDPTDPPVARPWVLREAAARCPEAADLERRFGGVVTLDEPAAGGERLDAWRAALRAVPRDVATVVYLDASVDATGALVADLLARLDGGDDAVAAAAPMTDALKRVDGDRVVASVDRRGLYRLGAPVVLRRAALDAVLAAAPGNPADPSGPTAPAALMLAAGRRVRIVPVDPAAPPEAGER